MWSTWIGSTDCQCWELLDVVYQSSPLLLVASAGNDGTVKVWRLHETDVPPKLPSKSLHSITCTSDYLTALRSHLIIRVVSGPLAFGRYCARRVPRRNRLCHRPGHGNHSREIPASQRQALRLLAIGEQGGGVAGGGVGTVGNQVRIRGVGHQAVRFEGADKGRDVVEGPRGCGETSACEQARIGVFEWKFGWDCADVGFALSTVPCPV